MCLFCNSCNTLFFVKHEGAVCLSDDSHHKTFWCNLIRITGLPVSFHKISILFHYFQIDDSNKAGSVAVGNLL